MNEQIIQNWKKGIFRPVYWLEGDEEFVIDELVKYAEHQILSEQEASFNLTVFYGRDAQWAEVLNACRRYPMFSERQVVLLKEAQHMRDIEKLEPYMEQPLVSTLLVVAYKGKKLDKRTKFCKTVQKHAEVVTTKKMYDDKLPDWTKSHVQSLGFSISEKAVMLLVDHIGNDLSRIVNEIDKIRVNLRDRTSITEDDVEAFVGISKEYNVFELQSALGRKDLPKAIRILGYFESNPKVAPIQLVLPVLYNFFSKIYMLLGAEASDEKTAASILGVSPFFVNDYLTASRNYGQDGVCQALLLLHHYNLKGIGIEAGHASDAELMREMIVKMMRG